MNEVFLGLGGNIGQRLKNLQEAVTQISEQIGKLDKASQVYETKAWGFNSEHLYLNQVIKVRSELSAQSVINTIGRIEKTFGRTRTNDRNADREMDIDLLFYNREIISEKELEVPHPRLHLRKFVLIPLMDIAPDFVHPVFGETVAVLLDKCPDQLSVKAYQD